MHILNVARNMAMDFAHEEDGSQVVEYALVIALVSIALALGLKVIAGSPPFSDLANRIANCFGTNVTSC